MIRIGVRLLAVALVVALLGVYPAPLKPVEDLQAGDRAFAGGDFGAAADAYLRAAQRVPLDSYPLEQAAHAEALAGRYEVAERHLRQVAAMRGWTPALWYRLGVVLYATGRPEAALTAWEAALAETPDHAETLRAVADFYLQGQDWARAIPALERLAAADPGDTEALYRLALLVAAYDPQAAQVYLAGALADLDFADAAGAVLAELEALSEEPDRAYANARLALTLIGLDEWEMAALALERALLLNPRYGEALAYLGLVRAHQGEGEEGLAMAWDAVQMAPESALARYALGRLYAAQGDYDAAIPVLLQAAALDSESATIAVELGEAYRQRGDLSDAVRWMRRATELDPDNVHLWEHLAAFYADLAYDLEGEGLTAINSAMLRAPDSADIHASLGWALYRVGQGGAAVREIGKALELDPTNLRAMYYHAVMLERRGDLAGAVEAYQEVIEAAPESGLARMADRALGRLLGLGE